MAGEVQASFSTRVSSPMGKDPAVAGGIPPIPLAQSPLAWLLPTELIKSRKNPLARQLLITLTDNRLSYRRRPMVWE
jgi:hypothetical protein